MGHTVDQWKDKVGHLLYDTAGVDISAPDLVEVGLRPAFAEHADRHPALIVEEIAGAGSSYLSLPSAWVVDWSEVLSVEYPARYNPPRFLDACAYRVGRATDVTQRKLVLTGHVPAVGEYVRVEFTGEWPFPGISADTDLMSARMFEAVAKLAAAHCCSALAAEAARGLAGGVSYEGTSRTTELATAANGFREDYDRAFTKVAVA